MNVHRIGGIGTVVECKILSGRLEASDQVHLVLSSGHVVKKQANSIEQFHESIKSANARDYCGIHLKGISTKDLHKGIVFGSGTNIVTYFEANIIVWKLQKRDTKLD